MNRKILIMGAVLIILALLCTTEQLLVHSITGDALAAAQEVIAGIREKRCEDMLAKAKALDQDWDKRARWLEILVDHSSTDDVRYALSRLIAALEQQDSATAMVYACELEGAVEHVYERQALTLENIF